VNPKEKTIEEITIEKLNRLDGDGKLWEFIDSHEGVYCYLDSINRVWITQDDASDRISKAIKRQTAPLSKVTVERLNRYVDPFSWDWCTPFDTDEIYYYRLQKPIAHWAQHEADALIRSATVEALNELEIWYQEHPFNTVTIWKTDDIGNDVETGNWYNGLIKDTTGSFLHIPQSEADSIIEQAEGKIEKTVKQLQTAIDTERTKTSNQAQYIVGLEKKVDRLDKTIDTLKSDRKRCVDMLKWITTEIATHIKVSKLIEEMEK